MSGCASNNPPGLGLLARKDLLPTCTLSSSESGLFREDIVLELVAGGVLGLAAN